MSMIFGGKKRQRLKELQAIGQKIETLSTRAQPFAHIVDFESPNSIQWQNAARELCRLTRESLDLARALDNPNILEIAESAAARVRTSCPVEAERAGL
jgi:hypothetical protein